MWRELHGIVTPLFILEVDCGPVSGVANGEATMNGSTIGGLAAYTCYEGFELIGDPTRICAQPGSWTGVEPKCKSMLICLALLEVRYQWLITILSDCA